MAAAKRACPICRKPASKANRYFPFCSERCRTLDLANWASGTYAIPAPLTEADEETAAPAEPDSGPAGDG